MAIKVVFKSIFFDIIIFGISIPYIFITVSNKLDKFFIFPNCNLVLLKLIGALLICIGSIFIIWAYYYLVKMGMGYTLEFFSIKLLPVTKRLVKTGPYSFVRHPMSFGYLMCLLGMSLVIGSFSGMFILLPLISVITILYLISIEEKSLYARFKEEFRDYKSKIPLIIPYETKKSAFSGRCAE